jgi:hypothetical protein
MARRRWLIGAVSAALLWVPLLPAGVEATDSLHRNAIEFSPLSPMIDIWAVQYARRSGADEPILGLAYTNIEYDHGRSHAPTLILGYRRYLWKRFHAEYQLWPSYNWYYEYDEEKYYPGFELWNELRAGWTFDFRLGHVPAFVHAQVLFGFALYGGNKPDSFEQQVEDEPYFASPMLFMGWRF